MKQHFFRVSIPYYGHSLLSAAPFLVDLFFLKGVSNSAAAVVSLLIPAYFWVNVVTSTIQKPAVVLAMRNGAYGPEEAYLFHKGFATGLVAIVPSFVMITIIVGVVDNASNGEVISLFHSYLLWSFPYYFLIFVRNWLISFLTRVLMQKVIFSATLIFTVLHIALNFLFFQFVETGEEAVRAIAVAAGLSMAISVAILGLSVWKSGHGGILRIRLPKLTPKQSSSYASIMRPALVENLVMGSLMLTSALVIGFANDQAAAARSIVQSIGLILGHWTLSYGYWIHVSASDFAPEGPNATYRDAKIAKGIAVFVLLLVLFFALLFATVNWGANGGINLRWLLVFVGLEVGVQSFRLVNNGSISYLLSNGGSTCVMKSSLFITLPTILIIVAVAAIIHPIPLIFIAMVLAADETFRALYNLSRIWFGKLVRPSLQT